MASSFDDFLTKALCRDPQTGAFSLVEAAEIHPDKARDYDYFCADCHERGYEVRLKFVKASEKKISFGKIDKNKGAGYTRPEDRPRAEADIERFFRHPAHFDRWPSAHKHRCDHPVRYAAFRQTAMRFNAQRIEPRSFMFPVDLPGKRWNDHDGIRPLDLRGAFRPAGLTLGGVQTAADWRKITGHFLEDPGLQYDQYFHDGYERRTFKEIFFESPAALHDFLGAQGARGRQQSRMVAYILNPNNHPQLDPDLKARSGFVDRSMPHLPDGKKLKLFACGMNGAAERALLEMVRREGWLKSAPVLVWGEASIDRDNAHHVRVEFYNPDQLGGWDKAHRLTRHYSPEKAQALAAQQELKI